MKVLREKDNQILKDSALVLADQIVSCIPALNIAWGFSKALYGAGLKIRQQKALEWVEMVRDNPNILTKELLEQEEFQDGFVYALEKYLIERNQEKRKYFRNIFLGYAQSKDLSIFPLEKFIHTLSQLSEFDVTVLRKVDPSRTDKNYQIYGNDNTNLVNIYNLINLGLLQTDPSSRLGPVNAPFVWLSTFGFQFMQFLKN